MTLKEKISRNPYLKASNCTDLSDVNAAIADVKMLLKEYDHDSPRLCQIYARLEKKKLQLEAKAS